MINNRTAIGIITARAGSKGLPGKNTRLLCGKPLINWTIEKALRSRHLDLVVVSTDGDEIADIARIAGAEVPFLRPAELATDTASSYDVIRHALAHYAPRCFDYTVLLEPTSPLREDDDVDRVLKALDEEFDRFDSIVTLGQVHEHPSIMKKLQDRAVKPFVQNLVMAGRRQDAEPAYFPYGVAYAAKTDVLLVENTFYTKRCMGFPIQRYQNYEIDDLQDFLCVEAVMRHQWELK
jgi:CMP-N,N'-diacetyllegionaminic acid synthase